MARIVGLSGSLRQGSFNTALLRAAAQVAPEGVTIEVRTIHGIPLYDADIENGPGIPQAVTKLKDEIASCDGLLLVTPEYNNSIPGVFKNAIDWMSRPPKDIPRVFGGKPVGLIGATIGGGGTALAQAAWLPVLRTLTTTPYFGPRVGVRDAAKMFDEHGALVDPFTRGQLEKFLAGFAAFVQSVSRS